MSVVQDILDDALIRSGLRSITDPVDAAVTAYSFNVLNRMLDQWTAEVGPLFNIQDSQVDAPIPGFTLVGGQAKYTLGPANLLGVRPPNIHTIYLLDNNNVSYYQTVISQDDYARLIYKVAPGRPYKVYINYNAATLDLYFYPTPSYTDSVHVNYLDPLAAFTSLAQTIVYPPGYEDTFINTLAVRLAVAFGKVAPATVVQQAAWGKQVLNANNDEPYTLQTPMPTMRRRFFNILTG